MTDQPPGIDLDAVERRWQHALAAKPSKGEIRDHTPIIESACDVPDLVRHLRHLRYENDLLRNETLARYDKHGQLAVTGWTLVHAVHLDEVEAEAGILEQLLDPANPCEEVLARCLAAYEATEVASTTFSWDDIPDDAHERWLVSARRVIAVLRHVVFLLQHDDEITGEDHMGETSGEKP